MPQTSSSSESNSSGKRLLSCSAEAARFRAGGCAQRDVEVPEFLAVCGIERQKAAFGAARKDKSAGRRDQAGAIHARAGQLVLPLQLSSSYADGANIRLQRTCRAFDGTGGVKGMTSGL